MLMELQGKGWWSRYPCCSPLTAPHHSGRIFPERTAAHGESVLEQVYHEGWWPVEKKKTNNTVLWGKMVMKK